MNIRSKKGMTLVETVASLLIAVTVIIAGLALYMVATGGFRGGTDDFDGNMQASLFQSFVNEPIHNTPSLSFTAAPAKCDAIAFQSGSLVYIKDYGKSSAYTVKIEDVSQISFTVDLNGQRCRLSYVATLSGNRSVNTYTGSFMLLNITSTAFSAANGGVSIPKSYVISKDTTTICYIGKN